MSQTSPWNKTFSKFNVSERVSGLQEAQCFGSAHNVDWAWWFVSDWNKQSNQLGFSSEDRKAHGSVFLRMFMSNSPQEHQFVSVQKCQTLLETEARSLWTSAMTARRMTACSTSASLLQVSSWSLFYPKLLHSQRVLHLKVEVGGGVEGPSISASPSATEGQGLF